MIRYPGLMILIAFTLSLCAAAGLIVGICALVSIESQDVSASRNDMGLI